MACGIVSSSALTVISKRNKRENGAEKNNERTFVLRFSYWPKTVWVNSPKTNIERVKLKLRIAAELSKQWNSKDNE